MERPERHTQLIEMGLTVIETSFTQLGSVMPHAMVWAGTGSVSCVASSFADNTEKNSFAATVRAVVVKERATDVVFMSESWSVRADTPEKVALYEAWRKDHPNGDLCDYPDHSEMVFMVIESAEGHSMYSREMSRSADGRPYLDPTIPPRTDEFWSWDAIDAHFKGRFTHFYIPTEAQNHEAARWAAEAYLKLMDYESQLITDEFLTEKLAKLARENSKTAH